LFADDEERSETTMTINDDDNDDTADASTTSPSKLKHKTKKRRRSTSSRSNNNRTTTNKNQGGGGGFILQQTILLACGVGCLLGMWMGTSLAATVIQEEDSISFRLHLENRPFFLAHNVKNKSVRTKQPPPQPPLRKSTTLALLYPPGLVGGYRNQVIRFFALVEYALQHNISQLYLPSLLWSTQVNSHDDNNGTASRRRQWDPVPMDWIFDIGHWNSIANATGLLPVLTDQLDGPTDCWVSFSDVDSMTFPVNSHHTTAGASNVLHYDYHNQTFNHLRHAAILQGGLEPIFTNVTLPLLMNPVASQLTLTRRTDYLANVEHCRNPYVFGGGTRQGRLWKHGTHLQSPDAVLSAMYRALRPMINVSCVPHPYTAVHARVELDMLQHQCGHDMERHLRNIVAQAHAVESNASYNLFIAVDREKMTMGSTTTADDEPYRYSHELQQIGLENIQYLEQIRQQPNVYECGQTLLQDFYHSHPDFLHRGTLLESVINFQIAVDADVFVGVAGSSYSTDVLRTRYFIGKRTENYRYTKTGVERVKGLVKPHTDCKHSNK
jgi:hypothetical protein